jgi:hypothetical protein
MEQIQSIKANGILVLKEVLTGKTENVLIDKLTVNNTVIMEKWTISTSSNNFISTFGNKHISESVQPISIIVT